MKKTNGILIFLFGVLLGGIIIRFGPNTNDIFENISLLSQNNQTTDTYIKNKYNRFEKIDNILNMGYYDKENIDTGHMIKEALKAYVNAIDDPYTVYMDAQENSGFMEGLQGEDDFEGIGCVVTKKDYYVLIEEVLKESPAFKAGIKPLDRVIKINTGYVEDETLNQAVSRMRGPAGTIVNVTIERYTSSGSGGEQKKEIIEKAITRGTINVPSVKSEILNIGDKKIGYIEIFIIGEETEKLFKKEIKILKNAGIDGTILDLRGNGGGLMPIAVSIVSHFIPKDKIVVSAKYKGYENEKYYSKGYGEFEGLPIVVLVDGMTASAGEIIAMALQEQAGAKLLGTTTFGKGTIQTLNEFEDGDSIKYTIGKRFAPSKQNINKIGVKPDITVEFDLTGYINNNIDNQLEEAKSIFK